MRTHRRRERDPGGSNVPALASVAMLLETWIPNTYIARKVQRDFVAVLAIATVVALVLYFEHQYLPIVPTALPAFLGTARRDRIPC